MFTRLFWKDAIERAIKTVAQAAVALLSVEGLNLLSLDWKGFMSAVALSGTISLLTSIASVGRGSTGSASLTVESKEMK